jgi:hypothetical protein
MAVWEDVPLFCMDYLSYWLYFYSQFLFVLLLRYVFQYFFLFHYFFNLKGNFAIFYMLAKYVPGDIKYIFTKVLSTYFHK